MPCVVVDAAIVPLSPYGESFLGSSVNRVPDQTCRLSQPTNKSQGRFVFLQRPSDTK